MFFSDYEHNMASQLLSLVWIQRIETLVSVIPYPISNSQIVYVMGDFQNKY